MRILAIGDIHGCASALDALLAEVAPTPEDTLVTLGDYCDRGLDTPAVLDRLIALGETTHLVALRGNHDQMMLNARRDPVAVPAAHWRFLEEQCVDFWECGTHFFVHGGVYPDLPLWEQPRYVLYWQRFERVRPHESGKVMVCGHTSQKSGLPRNLGHAVCLDTFAYGGGWLSCLDVGSGLVRQADHDRRVRQLWLAERLEQV